MLMLSIQSFMGTWANWLPLSILAVITAIVFHNVLLVIGRAFSIKELEAYAKSEILQAAASFFMAVFLVVMIGSAMYLAKGFIAGDLSCGGVSHKIVAPSTETPSLIDPGGSMNDAYDAIRCRIQTRAVEVAGIQDALITDWGSRLDFNSLNMGFSVFGITLYRGDWNSAVYQETETKRITNNLATVLLIGLNAQGALLEYLKINMLHVFLPFGILLRCFHFTRGVGALMISLGIGMYFIFPVFFVLLDPGFTPSPPAKPVPIANQPQYCYATMSNSVSLLTSVQSSAGLGSTASLSVDMNRDDLSKSYISLIIHPLVALFLTLVFVRYMMTILGGEPYELMKMVSKVI